MQVLKYFCGTAKQESFLVIADQTAELLDKMWLTVECEIFAEFLTDGQSPLVHLLSFKTRLEKCKES